MLVELQVKHALNPVAVDHSRQTETDVGDAVVVLNEAGYGEDGVLVTENGFDNAHESGSNGVVGCAFALDDLIGRIAGIDKDPLHLLDFVFAVAGFGEVAQLHPRNICQGPDGDFAVAMLADDPGVNAAGIDAEVVTEQGAEARGIENGAGAEDALRRKSGILQGGVGEHVDGIGGDENDAVGIVASDFGDNLSEDGGVTLHEVETGLAGLLRGACGDYGDGGAGAIRIVSGPDVGGVGEGDGMTQVHGFALGLGAIHVDKDDFSGEATEHERIGKSSAHIAKSDDGNTSSAVGTVHLDHPSCMQL